MEELIKCGIDRNMVCYDADENSLVISSRLVSLMSVISNRTSPLCKVYINDNYEGDYKYNFEFIKVDDDLTNLYIKNGGTLSCHKQRICLGVSENGTCIFGMY
mgnify:CR=1 FL=1